MTQTINLISDRAVKLAALAMDNAAAPGERRNAAEMFFREISKAGLKPRDLQSGERILYQEKVVYRESQSQQPQEYQMPFGKYRGRQIDDILQSDRAYLQWAYWNASALGQYPDLKNYIGGLLAV